MGGGNEEPSQEVVCNQYVHPRKVSSTINMLILPMGNIVVDGVTMDFLKFEVESICFF